MESKIIYKNDLVTNIYAACSCCYNNNKAIDYLEKTKYIEKRINAGHDSILEHGRVVIEITGIENEFDIINLITNPHTRFLQFYSTCNYTENKNPFKKLRKTKKTYNLIINGDVRAYKEFITNIGSHDLCSNVILNLCNTLQTNLPKCLFGKTFKINEEDPDFTFKFNDIEIFNDNNENDFNRYVTNPYEGLHYGIVIKNVKVNNVPVADDKAVKSVDIGFDREMYRKLLNNVDFEQEANLMMPVTVVFKNISRTATHQLVRHRNAITQESQRYVNYSDASFTIPLKDYDKDKQYSVKIGNIINNGSLDTIVDDLISVYPQLMQAGLKKEEARAFLPSNVNCGKLYMTFTVFSLLKFLELRTDPHAQYEIRQYAQTIKEKFDKLLTF